VPVIAFARGAGTHLRRLVAELGADAYGLDTAADPVWAARETAGRAGLQGNLDPLALLAGGAALDHEVEAILDALKGHPHIFNLGHGILPQTPIAHVERLVDLIRKSRT
jgi:uroporphyrinogen decarboxylase